VPQDFAAYFCGEWEPQHGTKEKGVAPSTVNSLISHLAVEIDTFGGGHFWAQTTSSGRAFSATSSVHIHRSMTLTAGGSK